MTKLGSDAGREGVRVVGVVYEDGQPREVSVDVPPGCVADAVRAGTLWGLSVDVEPAQLWSVACAVGEHVGCLWRFEVHGLSTVCPCSCHEGAVRGG